MTKKENDDKFILGGILRLGYETLKSNLKTEENKTLFEFVESLGGNIRKSLEDDPKYEKIYQGADIVRKGKEFWDEIKKYLSEE